MKTSELQKIFDCVDVKVDVLSKRGDVFSAKRSYYWGISSSGEGFKDKIVKALEANDGRIKIEVVEFGNHAHSFVGSAKAGSAQDSYFWVKFKIVPNNEMVESRNMLSGEKIMIRACDKGGCCDPATETYWSM